MLDGSPEVLRDVATATNFGTQFAITGSMASDMLKNAVNLLVTAED